MRLKKLEVLIINLNIEKSTVNTIEDILKQAEEASNGAEKIKEEESTLSSKASDANAEQESSSTTIASDNATLTPEQIGVTAKSPLLSDVASEGVESTSAGAADYSAQEILPSGQTSEHAEL